MEDYLHSEYQNLLELENESILNKAEIALRVRPFHITDIIAPLSEGGPHDYYSNGDYWWPNPETPDGLPYINRDGESNPGNFNGHRLLLRQLRTSVSNLAAAYLVTGQEAYASKAVLLLKEFFLDRETRMNPHLLYAQAIPGICSGRGIGIIDTLHLAEVPMAIESLRNSAAMTPEIYTGLKQWFRDYLKWMTTHQYGIEEMNAYNNHSVAWLVQAVSFGLFTRDSQLVSFCRNRYKSVILPNQMAHDGSFPAELARTKPYSYSIFILENLGLLCFLLSNSGEDLWRYQLEDGRNIKKALEFYYPYLLDKSIWPYAHDIQHFEDWPTRIAVLLFAGLAFGELKYLKLWRQLGADPGNMEVRRNLPVRQPLLWLQFKKEVNKEN